MGREKRTVGKLAGTGAARDGGSIVCGDQSAAKRDRCVAGSQPVSEGEAGYRRPEAGYRIRQ